MESPLSPEQLLDEYFVENRNRILEAAAFLDRLDRAHPRTPTTDFRLKALHAALDILAARSSNHVSQIQLLLSDPTAEPIPALDRKSAVGAWDRWNHGGRQ